MFTWFYRYLPIVLTIFIVGCKMSSTSTLQENDDNKVNFRISGTKESGIQTNN